MLAWKTSSRSAGVSPSSSSAVQTLSATSARVANDAGSNQCLMEQRLTVPEHGSDGESARATSMEPANESGGQSSELMKLV